MQKWKKKFGYVLRSFLAIKTVKTNEKCVPNYVKIGKNEKFF